ncbi:MAG: hypothetical protein ACSHX7_12055 [Luteolibacter sp.]
MSMVSGKFKVTGALILVGAITFVISMAKFETESEGGQDTKGLRDPGREAPAQTNAGLRVVKGDISSLDLDDALRIFEETGDRADLLRCFDTNFTQSLAWLADRSLEKKSPSLARVCGFCVGFRDKKWSWDIFTAYFDGEPSLLNEAKSGAISGLLSSGRIDRSLESLAEIEEGIERDRCMVQVLLILSEDNPSWAVMMMKQWVEDGGLRTIDQSKLLGSIVANATGAAEVEEILALEDFNGLAVSNPSVVARAIANSNIDLATSWSLGLDDWVKSRSAVTGIVELQIHRGLDDEAMQIISEAENIRGGGGYVRSAVMEIAKISPERAIAFIDKIPQNLDGHTGDAIILLADVWYAQDGVALSKWVTSLEAGSKKDLAIRALSMKIYRSDPQLAAEWASQIEEPEMRLRLTRFIKPKPEE